MKIEISQLAIYFRWSPLELEIYLLYSNFLHSLTASNKSEASITKLIATYWNGSFNCCWLIAGAVSSFIQTGGVQHVWHALLWCQSRGGSYMAQQRNWPIFSTRFGKFVYILVDFGKQEYYQTRKFCILKDGKRQSSNSTDTLILLEH